MTTKPPDPLATRHDGTTDQDDQAPVDPHTQRLREENRALRELLAAQVQASIPRPPGPLKRLGWWLISAPGAALVGWRSLLGREHAAPITGKRVGYATLTVLYTLAIYGALVLLVVSCSTPNAGRSGASAAGPMRVPLAPLDAGPAPLRQPGATARPDAAPPPANTPPPRPHADRARTCVRARLDTAGRRDTAGRHGGAGPHGRPQPGGDNALRLGSRSRDAACDRPGLAQTHVAHHRNPRRKSTRMGRQPEGRTGALRHAGLFRAARLRLGRPQAILRPEPGLGRRQGMPGPTLTPRNSRPRIPPRCGEVRDNHA